jgi:hypothetical protein
MYSTLVDPIRLWRQLEQYHPAKALHVAEVWRQKLLEYTFRLTAMEKYEDFEWVRNAFDYALGGSRVEARRGPERRAHGSIQRPWNGSPMSGRTSSD